MATLFLTDDDPLFAMKATAFKCDCKFAGTKVYSRINGIISTSEMINEIGSTVGTSVTGSIGAAIGVGRALSDVVISMEWYQDFKFNVNYGIMEYKIGTPNESNQQLWMDFINNYK